MGFKEILIGTGIVWGLTVVVVFPLAKVIQRRWFADATTAEGLQSAETEGLKETFSPAAFMIADTIVLAIAGFVLGITTGWWFVGVAFQRYHWPGLLAFVGFSLLGSHLWG